MPNLYKVPRFTKDAAKAIVKENFDEKGWEAHFCPGNLHAFIVNQIAEMKAKGRKINKEDAIMVCTIDGEYIEFLKDNMLQNSEESLNRYLDLIDLEAGNNLLKNKEYNVTRNMFGIPILLDFTPGTNKTTNTTFVIDDKSMINEIGKNLAEMYAGFTVYITGTIVRPETMVAYDTEKWFENSIVKDDMHSFERASFQSYDSPYLPFAVCYIPFLLETKSDKCIFSINKVMEYEKKKHGVFSDTKVLEEANKNINNVIQEGIDESCKAVIVGPPVLNEFVIMQSGKITENYFSALKDLMNKDNKRSQKYLS